jgi:cytochrome P450
MMLATMFDWPQERRQELLYWSDVATANLNAPNPIVATEDERYAVLEQMADAFEPFWQVRRGDGAGFDLISMLVNNPSTANMSRAEFIGTLFLLIVGGNDTTRNSMSGGLLALREYPDEWSKVQHDPSLIPTFVSETIRWQTPVIHMRRTAVEDVNLAGQRIKAGDKVVLWYSSGNRDETVFANANAFIADRHNARRHLAFGAGVHRCVGDQLAEQQLRILWEEILACGLRFEIIGEPVRTYSNFIRGFSEMQVRII